MALIAELKRRKVLQVGAAYLVVGWLLMQVASIALPAFQAPEWALRTFIFLLALGFPLALVLAWVLDLTPEGLRLDDLGIGTKRLFTVAAVLAALAIGWFLRGLGEAPETPVGTTRSIAVLPFANLSADPEQEYFSDGLAEEMLSALARVPDLQVIARTSSFAFKGKESDLATIARTLAVAHILEGSVRRSGDRLRIAVRLVHAADGAQLWSETYDRQMTDVFVVQDEIARAVVKALELRLRSTTADATPSHVPDPAAYNEYLIGRQLFARGGEENYRLATAAYSRAIEADPRFAAAYAGLAFAEIIGGAEERDAGARARRHQRARAAAERAIELDPALPDGHAARGQYYQVGMKDLVNARTNFERALALDPNHAETLRRYARLLSGIGRMDEALTVAQRVTVLDPLSAPGWNSYALRLRDAVRPQEAMTSLRRALEINPDYAFAHGNLARLLLRAGKTAEAAQHFARATPSYQLAGLAMVRYTLGDSRGSEEALEQLKREYPRTGIVRIAEVHAWRGEDEECLTWLERGARSDDSEITSIARSPDFRRFHAEPRFQKLVRELGLRE